jgi:ribosomal-protein-alanine N-acetyltransferase
MYTLETNRLVLRPFTWDDFDFVKALNCDPEIARYIGYGKPRTESESLRWMKRTLAAYCEGEVGHLAVFLKDTGILIGRCGLSLLEIEADPTGDDGPHWFWYRNSVPEGMKTIIQIELGYTLAKEYWGCGYATESAQAVRDFAFRERGEKQLVAAISSENVASKNVARKLGLSRRGKIMAFGLPAEHWEIKRSEWERLSSQ